MTYIYTDSKIHIHKKKKSKRPTVSLNGRKNACVKSLHCMLQRVDKEWTNSQSEFCGAGFHLTYTTASDFIPPRPMIGLQPGGERCYEGRGGNERHEHACQQQQWQAATAVRRRLGAALYTHAEACKCSRTRVREPPPAVRTRQTSVHGPACAFGFPTGQH
jgi:hypothetical protein